MAPKKGIFFDNPPSVSSTSVEEEDDSSSQDVQHSQIPPPSTPISNPKSVSTPRSGSKRSLHSNTNGSDAKLSKKKKTVSASGGCDENENENDDQANSAVQALEKSTN
ncbi:hypothetical protein TSUD_135180 [Trifolium subterraneum]|uniref:Uncharacterized protein n=1 Tax=Trifolium subterraneum TaxID=3900 RepID=A0A2Z6NFT2_TRISU|nr:hypothetical protein TSUD_135180 [Trifolium subterraneum]